MVLLTGNGRRDLLEILDDRHNRQSTVVTRPLSVPAWNAYPNEPTLADVILDQLAHSACTLKLTENPCENGMAVLQQCWVGCQPISNFIANG